MAEYAKDLSCQEFHVQLREESCDVDEEQQKAYAAKILTMYRNGEYDLPALTLMLLDVPGLDAAGFLQRNIPLRVRRKEFNRLLKVAAISERIRSKLEIIYFG
jgi:hypothetical protein